MVGFASERRDTHKDLTWIHNIEFYAVAICEGMGEVDWVEVGGELASGGDEEAGEEEVGEMGVEGVQLWGDSGVGGEMDESLEGGDRGWYAGWRD